MSSFRIQRFLLGAILACAYNPYASAEVQPLVALGCGGHGCNQTTVNCGGGDILGGGTGMPSGAGGTANTEDPNNCQINLEQEDCDSCGISSGQTFSNPGDSLCSPSHCMGPTGVFECVQAACLVQHEQQHTNQSESCHACRREQEAYQGSAGCVGGYLSQSCGSPPYSGDCQDLQDLATLDSQAAQYMACLCQKASEGGGGSPPQAGASYPDSACAECGSNISNAADRAVFNQLYCTPNTVSGQNGSYVSWNAQNFTPEQRADSSISGEDADPDHDGISNFYEYAFNSLPMAANTGPAVQAFFVNDYFTLQFRRNKTASDLVFRVGAKSGLFDPWSYTVLGAPSAGDQMVIRSSDTLDDPSTQLVTATDTVHRLSVQMRLFKVEVLRRGEVLFARSINISSSASFFMLDLSPGTGGSIVSDAIEVNCSTDCSARLAAGTSVTINAVPAPGFRFDGWDGDCGGNLNECALKMTKALHASARFAPEFICGDGIKNGSDGCDGTDLGGLNCASAAPSAPNGTLSCTSSCTLDLSGCCSAWHAGGTAAACGGVKCGAGEGCQVRSCGAATENRCVPLITAPSALTISQGTKKKRLQLNWSASSHQNGAALTYSVYRSRNNGKFSRLAKTKSISVSTPQPGYGVTYRYFVVAIDSAKNQSAPSGEVSFATPPRVKPSR